MSRPAYFVGPWDLDRRLACVPDDPAAGTVVMVESVGRSRAMPFHKKKLVLVVSALRHFAAELRAAGHEVELVRASTYAAGIARHVARHQSTKVVALAPRDHGIDQRLRTAELGAPLELHDDGGPGGHFLLTRDEFAAWADGRDQLRMDVFYRWMRKRTGILMDGGKPVGGRWSFDKDNRKPAREARPPALPQYPPDALTAAVMDEVEGWGIGWASTAGFAWPVTRAQALDALSRFVDERLVLYGDHQDAMLTGEPFLWHACIAPALNLGLLSPDDLLAPVLAAHAEGRAPLNAVEGFVRQVIGWREFIRGVYLTRMPGLRSANRFGAEAPLPPAFWDPDQTDMACLHAALSAVHRHGYAHHIQRLMVLGNLALLLGVRPLALSHWFWAAFVDAHEWVELPNVHGMALAADPTFTTKPYAASGAYIHRMSDHCGRCPYRVRQRTGALSCPFNSLFWSFMVRHRETLATNPRLAVLYRSWDRWDEDEHAAIHRTAALHRERLLTARGAPLPAWTFDDDAG